ncbi:hypothetical protein GQ457_07G021480 [Hibiscus cannabinus]
MKKEAKPRNVIFTFLLKAVSAVVSVGFQNPPVSLSRAPGRDKRATSAGKGKALLPRPTISRKSKSETQESTSPEVSLSCMGQIRHKKNMEKGKRNLRPVSDSETESTHKTSSDREVKKQEALGNEETSAQVKRFTSCGDGFEWTTQIADNRRDYCFHEDEGVIVTFALPLPNNPHAVVAPPTAIRRKSFKRTVRQFRRFTRHRSISGDGVVGEMTGMVRRPMLWVAS